MKARNPRTGAFDYEFSAASESDVAAVAARLRAHQPAWDEGGFSHRSKALLAWAEELERRQAELLDALVADTGRLTLSRNEVAGAPKRIRRWCRQGPTIAAAEMRQAAE